MTDLSLQQAGRIVDAGLLRARELGLKPMTIAVLDAGGHLVALKREDHSGILRPEIAQGKAWGALGMGLGSRALAHRAEIAPAFFVSLASVSQGRLIPVAGGVLIRGSGQGSGRRRRRQRRLPGQRRGLRQLYGIEQAGC